jgi:hypothetical protein
MMRLPLTMTLAALKEHEALNPQMPQFAHRMTALSYSDFVDTVYVQLEAFMRDLERDRNYYQDASENLLNSSVARHFRALGYTADFDKNNGGHADITVQFADYEWIGEGKVVDSVNNSYLTKGYDQLIYRYGLGKPKANQAAVLIYSFGPDTPKVVSKWAEHLNQVNAVNAGYAEGIYTPLANQGFTIECEHRHVGGGKLFIRSVGFQLYWNPADAATARQAGA